MDVSLKLDVTGYAQKKSNKELASFSERRAEVVKEDKIVKVRIQLIILFLAPTTLH
jgi:hypothetical protein